MGEVKGLTPPDKNLLSAGSALDRGRGLSIVGNNSLRHDRMPAERMGQHCRRPNSQPRASRGSRGSLVPTKRHVQLRWVLETKHIRRRAPANRH